jgi:predicted secreted protein
MTQAFSRALIVLGLGSVLAAGAARADMPPPSGVVNLTATASAEVARDLMSVVLTTTREGPDAQAVQTAVKQALDAALAEARRVAKPGQVDVQTGNFSLSPRYSSKGQMIGWQGSAELLIEGRDMPAIAQLVGRISSLTIARVGYNISRELREKTEAEVSAQAIARYRAKAAEAARAFGYGGYTLREVTVGTNEPPSGVVPMMRAQAMSTQAESAPLPVEAGRAVVSVSVNGTVQLTK